MGETATQQVKRHQTRADDLETDNNRLRVENEKLRLAGNELANVVDRECLGPASDHALAEWREALR